MDGFSIITQNGLYSKYRDIGTYHKPQFFDDQSRVVQDMENNCN